MIAFVIQFLRWIFLISQPLIVTLILKYIQDPKGEDGGIIYGLGLVLLYISIDVSAFLLIERYVFIQLVLGEKAKYAIIAIIYDKVLALSSATNKEFTQGEVINFISVDVEKIPNLTDLLPLVSRFPMQLLVSIILLSFYFGLSLLGSIGVGFGLSFVGFLIAKAKAKVQVKILKEKDKRMRITTEIVQNIKTIKLNSWIDYFVTKVIKFRNQEIFLTKLGLIFTGLSISVGRLIAPAWIITILAIFFSTGNNISVATAFGGIQVLRTLEHPLRWIPDFVSTYLEFSVSMKRIQRFLLWSELNPNLINSNNKDAINKGVDILVENANFTWGGQSEKLDNKNTKSK